MAFDAKAYLRKYRAEHKAELAEAKRKYYAEHKAELAEARRKYRAEHPEVYERRSERDNLLKKIHALRKRKNKSPMLEQRLACFERAYELNFVENKFEPKNPKIPLCAINAGLKG